MSNLEEDPAELVCRAGDAEADRQSGGQAGGQAGVEVLTPREVPLGGPRAMLVRRTLPQRHRSLIGAWCFVDHYGPDDVAKTGGMSVAPHPHTGLATVSWLFTGEIAHRDSIGTEATVRPGEVNLMTGGHGISHTEISTPETTILHGAQLWVALPAASRDAPPAFEHHTPGPINGQGWEARVFLGSLLGDTSPVTTHTPLLGAELTLTAGTKLDLDVDVTFEHGLLVDAGVASLNGQVIKQTELAYAAPDQTRLRVTAHEDARLLLLGGPPFGEPILMWWNFVGRTHEEIVGFREEWQSQISADGQRVHEGRFGIVINETLPPIPAPPMPNARLRQRR